jgi:Domain of unknown function (DUF4381)
MMAVEVPIHRDGRFSLFVIPGSTKPVPHLIRGNPVFKVLVPCFRRDDVWIPAFAGMTPFPLSDASMSNSALQRLHEIILPDPVSWMPQTIGWYAIFGLILFVAGWWVHRSLRHYRTNRYRRLALKELTVIERELQQPEKRAKALSEIPVLLKRASLSAFPRSEVAGLSGEKWLAFLDKTMGGKNFTQGEGRLLPELAYAPVQRIAQLPDEQIGKLLQLIRRWIKIHVTSEQ